MFNIHICLFQKNLTIISKHPVARLEYRYRELVAGFPLDALGVAGHDHPLKVDAVGTVAVRFLNSYKVCIQLGSD